MMTLRDLFPDWLFKKKCILTFKFNVKPAQKGFKKVLKKLAKLKKIMAKKGGTDGG